MCFIKETESRPYRGTIRCNLAHFRRAHETNLLGVPELERADRDVFCRPSVAIDVNCSVHLLCRSGLASDRGATRKRSYIGNSVPFIFLYFIFTIYF